MSLKLVTQPLALHKPQFNFKTEYLALNLPLCECAPCDDAPRGCRGDGGARRRGDAHGDGSGRGQCTCFPASPRRGPRSLCGRRVKLCVSSPGNTDG